MQPRWSSSIQAVDREHLRGPPIRYQARDGLTLRRSYSRFCRVVALHKRLPLIIMPHGGPRARQWATTAFVQFSPSSGYAVAPARVLGLDRLTARISVSSRAKGESGLKMQDDLDDAIDWLAKQGSSTRSACASSALPTAAMPRCAGAIRNPERYRCACQLCRPVSDLQGDAAVRPQAMLGKRLSSANIRKKFQSRA